MLFHANARSVLAATVLTVVASAAVAPVAHAADPQLFTPATPVVYDWSGAYVGLSAGASWESFDTAIGAPLAQTNFDASGFTGGAFGGMNFQNGPFVYGVELDVNFNTADASGVIAGIPVTAQTDWFSTLRGRAGFAFDRYMIYGTGGVAVGDVELSAAGTSFSDTRFGWTAGAGIEAALTENFTLRGEYLYTDLGKASGTLGGSPFSTEFDSHTVRAGVTYKFN